MLISNDKKMLLRVTTEQDGSEEKFNDLMGKLTKSNKKELKLSDLNLNKLEQGKLTHLFSSIKQNFTQLTLLDINGNWLGNATEVQLKAIFNIIRDANILSLNLSHNNLNLATDKKLQAMIPALFANKKLRSFDLSHNNISEKQLDIIANCLKFAMDNGTVSYGFKIQGVDSEKIKTLLSSHNASGAYKALMINSPLSESSIGTICDYLYPKSSLIIHHNNPDLNKDGKAIKRKNHPNCPSGFFNSEMKFDKNNKPVQQPESTNHSPAP